MPQTPKKEKEPQPRNKVPAALQYFACRKPTTANKQGGNPDKKEPAKAKHGQKGSSKNESVKKVLVADRHGMHSELIASKRGVLHRQHAPRGEAASASSGSFHDPRSVRSSVCGGNDGDEESVHRGGDGEQTAGGLATAVRDDTAVQDDAGQRETGPDNAEEGDRGQSDEGQSSGAPHAGDQPTGEEPAGEESAGEESAGEESAGEEPAEEEPAGSGQDDAGQFDAGHAAEEMADAQQSTKGYLSPEEAIHKGLRSRHRSPTDTSLTTLCEKTALDFDGQSQSDESSVSDPEREWSPSSPLGYERFGAAAEYYEACRHDMHSAEPYFKCQNHVCLPSRVGPAEVVGGEEDGLREDEGQGGDGSGMMMEEVEKMVEKMVERTVERMMEKRLERMMERIVEKVVE